MDIASTTDEWLKKTAAESVKHGENLRSSVRDLTLKALQGRELTLARVDEVLRSVAQGINMGSEGLGGRTDKIFSDALKGMDEALLRAAQASHIALSRLTEDGDFDQSQLKRALDELERFEDSLFGAVRDAASSASDKVRQQWGALIDKTRASGSGTGAEVAATLQDYGARARDAMRQSREATFKTAHQLSQNFATLASGVLIGLSEALHQNPVRGTDESHARPSSPAGGAPAPARKSAKSSPGPARKSAKSSAAPARKSSAKGASGKRGTSRAKRG